MTYHPGTVFTKGLSQVSGLSWLYFCTKVKPKTWLRPFVNTAPAIAKALHNFSNVVSELKLHFYFRFVSEFYNAKLSRTV